MKVTVNIDCTPVEARTFMGLPNLEPMQEQVMGEIQRRMMETLSLTDPQQLLKYWLSWGENSREKFSSFLRGMSSTSDDKS